MIFAAATAAAEEGTKTGFSIIFANSGELIWGAIAFIVLFVLLWKFAFPGIKTVIEKRASAIEGDLKKAEQAKIEAEGVLGEYRKQLASARDEAGKIIEEARQNADNLRTDVLLKAERHSREIIERGNRDIQAAVGAAQNDLRANMSDLAIELAGRILGRELDDAAQRDTVDDFVRELDEMDVRS